MKLSQIIQAWENGETIEVRNSGGEWRTAKMNGDLEYYKERIEDNGIRIKPRTLSINGKEFPEPMREAPEPDTWIYVASPLIGGVNCYCWGMMDMDKWLETGFLHLTREAAEQHLEAILSVTRKD